MRLGSLDQSRRSRPERGFTLIEMLIVVAIIMIMAAVAVPYIVGFLRNYRLNGALREVSSEMQAARTKAIMGNVNQGVSFLIVDRNSYRWVIEDTVPPSLGPLRDLPQNIAFDQLAGGGATSTLRFNRLGNYCNPAVAPCAGPFAAAWCTAAEAPTRCQIAPAPGVTYMDADIDPTVAVGAMRIVLVDARGGAPLPGDHRRTVRIVPGGRILSQQQ